MKTQDMADVNVEKIGALFPNALTEVIREDGSVERAIDFDVLRQELSKDIVEGPQERYQFTWPDKRKAIRLANTPTTMTLRPCREESVNFDNTGNLYIEGDNLEVLKILRETYLGKVKMIYIDPPYNTGNDFVYEDNFSQAAADYAGNSGQTDTLGNRLVQNTESNGRFHTDWLNMIYPRLKVAKDLLSPAGFIFVSIDEGEVENLKKVMNEIFGEANLVEAFFWESIFRPSNMSKTIRKNGEYVLCYRKSAFDYELVEAYEDPQGDASLTQNNNSVRALTFPAGYVKIKLPNGTYQKGVYDSIEVLDDIIVKDGTSTNDFRIAGKFKWSQEFLNEEINKGVTLTIKSSSLIPYYRKDYQKTALRPTKIISRERVADVLRAGAELKQLFEQQLFDYPKPTSLICFLANIIGFNDGIVLDFFSGSGTTAHAIMKLNAEDGGQRQFIMVQLPENTDPKSEAYKAGFKNICEIGKERIRRAGQIVLKQNSEAKGEGLFESLDDEVKQDVGFRVLKLDTSNMNDVFYRPEEFTSELIKDENFKEDRTAEDKLFQVMLDCNIPLSAKIVTTTIAGKEVFDVNDGYLLACFDEKVNETVITEAAKRQPIYFVMCDASLESDNVADNFEQIFKVYSKDSHIMVL